MLFIGISSVVLRLCRPPSTLAARYDDPGGACNHSRLMESHRTGGGMMTTGEFRSTDPASGEVLWEGRHATGAECGEAVAAARAAFAAWSRAPSEERIAAVRRFGVAIGERRDALAVVIARETGKPLWEAKGE